jgi:hypothetical protein
MKNFAFVAVMTLALTSLTGQTASAGNPCCEPVAVCCPCPPPPVMVPLCIKDPCTCCVYEECICLPACCVGEVPCMTWKKGLFGRKILTYKWACCGHCVEVVITKHGKVIVR